MKISCLQKNNLLGLSLTVVVMTVMWAFMIVRPTQAFVQRSPLVRSAMRVLSAQSLSPVVNNQRPRMTMFSTTTPVELEELNEKIKVKGDEIRKLKEDGIDKTELAPHVEELLALKAQLPQEEREKPKTKKKIKKQQPKNKNKPAKKPVEEIMSESELRLNRLSKVEAMREAGVDPFAYSFTTTHTAKQLLSIYDGKLEGGEEDEEADVAIAGRIMTRRVFGKLAFFTLQDETGTIQLQFDKNRLGDSFKVGVWRRRHHRVCVDSRQNRSNFLDRAHIVAAES